mmetsp:Transcript_25514/g.39527  ORF Transcript_25514/g.39527 Transcript_25514/m.39527 type:complete len:249 (+) Transcript_25514:47-793(+)
MVSPHAALLFIYGPYASIFRLIMEFFPNAETEKWKIQYNSSQILSLRDLLVFHPGQMVKQGGYIPGYILELQLYEDIVSVAIWAFCLILFCGYSLAQKFRPHTLTIIEETYSAHLCHYQMTVKDSDIVDSDEHKNKHNSDEDEVDPKCDKLLLPICACCNGNNKGQSSRMVDASCVICLSRYVEGDTVVWSSNKECVHAFHKHCVMKWIMLQISRNGRKEKPVCPYCRRVFVSLKRSEKNKIRNCLRI